jgi:cell division protein FtsZ
VTGGPDLTLAEVNEASSIIHAAAHEESNIIFGAVIDPRLEGKVKITVIATGFDREGSRLAVPGSAKPTPVDLSAYSGWARLRTEAADAAAPRVTIARRHGVGVAVAPPALAAAAAGAAAELDVPAFMRRLKHA